MSKGIFDDAFDDEKNRLSEAAKIEKGDAGNLFLLDVLETTINFIFTVYSAIYKPTSVVLIFTEILLAFDVLPKVMFRMTFYRFLRHNQDSKSFRIFGIIVELFLFTCLILYSATLYLGKIGNYSKLLVILSMLLTYLLGMLDKTVSLLLGKVKMDKKVEDK